MLWTEKYRPKTLNDVMAGKETISKVLEWAKNWQKGAWKPLLLAGPPGIGKTSLAMAIANTMKWEFVEMNASDQRNWEIINKIVGEGAFNETISDEGEFLSSRSGRLKLIVLDEVDNIHKKEDVGGESALIRIIKRKPRQPIILIANDPYQLSPELRKLCEFIEFRRLTKTQILKVLQEICAREGIECEKEALQEIAENAGGDLRAAINDLQAIAEGKKEISVEDVIVSKRTQEVDVFKVLQKIFKTNYSPYGDAMLLDESPEDLIQWIEENLPLEYSGEDLFRGYLALSRADIFISRVKKRQFYRLWKYATYLMTNGVQQMREETKSGFTKYKRPQTWQFLFQTKQKRELKDGILKKISNFSHLSTKKAKSEILPILTVLLKNLDIERSAKIAVFYQFNREELEFLVGEKAEEIIKFIEENKLHRIDESWVSTEISERLDLVKKEEKAKEEQKSKEKRVKDLTLDSFFS
ncbi:MAG: replication factor C large subunit [Archaeoglobaceae archaeon]|nr:replication factor C large subunit [Archaeoglobaceae archaeon]MDW8128011.1 replication factor C large subunit [Archaeoglobaceae archaeon]